MIKDVHINNPKYPARGDGIPSRLARGLREIRHFGEELAPRRSRSRVVGYSVLCRLLFGSARRSVSSSLVRRATIRSGGFPQQIPASSALLSIVLATTYATAQRRQSTLRYVQDGPIAGAE